jgi:superfamily II DNA/RNA helicase
MDFQRFGIDPRLARAAEALPTNFFFYEKMLAHVVEAKENVCVKIALDNGREEVLLLPALQWLLSEEGGKLLVVVPDAEASESCRAAIGRLGSGAGIEICRVLPGEQEAEPSRLEGDPSAAVLVGRIEDLLATPELNLRDYGFVVVDGVDRLADIPAESIRKFCSLLLPSWERRSVLACARMSVRAKNLAWDLADNPVEISIEGEVAKAQSVLKETWSVPGESKLKFLLGLLVREQPVRLCVFCNLKDTASEVARRLSANGISTDSIIGPLLPERKFALIEKFRAGDSTCLVLSDEGAEGLSPGVFPLIVNYDIPLEAELFVKRLEMLDRSDPKAKVVSLACDRYIYGLPAVEQYIDAKLDPLPIDESMLAIADKSEGMGGDRRPRGEAYARDARRGQPQRGATREARGRDGRGPNPNGGISRDGNRGREPLRDGNRFHDSQRDGYSREGRSPDIRKSISEATGGALDMSSGVPDSGYPRPPAAAKAPSARGPSQSDARRNKDQRGQRPPEGQPQAKKEGRNKDSRRGGGRAAAQRQPGTRQPLSQQNPQTNSLPTSSRPGAKPAQGTAGNPYDMPMEERMRLYREKYGRGMGKDKAPGDRGARQERKGGEQGGQRGAQARGQGREPSQEGQQGKRPGGHGSQPQAKRNQPGPERQGGAAQRSPRPAKLPDVPRAQAPAQNGADHGAEPGARPEGVVGRLLGAFRKKRA